MAASTLTTVWKYVVEVVGDEDAKYGEYLTQAAADWPGLRHESSGRVKQNAAPSLNGTK